MIWNRILAKLPAGSLGRRALTSGSWSLAELGIGNVLRLANNLVMTRLLVPEAFGLMAMVTTIHMAVGLMSDIGIRQSIIRSEQAETATFLRVAWTVQILRGAVMALAVLLLGGAIQVLGPSLAVTDTVYASPALPPLVMAYALVIQAEAFVSTNIHLAARHMIMGRIAILNIVSQVVSILVMIGIASLYPTVWALFFGSLTASLLRMVASHVVFSGPRMSMAWAPEIRDELWQFGKWIIGSSALGFLTRHADRLILGALLPTKIFSLYVIALIWVQAYGMAINQLSGQIGLPSLSEVLRNRPSDLPRLFRKYARAMDLLCLAGFLAFLLAGKWLIALLYTEDYRQAGHFMPLLAVLILVQRFTTFTQLLVSMGNSLQLMLANAMGALAICILIPAGYAMLGINGAIMASLLSPLASATVQMRQADQTLGGTLREDWVWFLAIPTIAVIILVQTGQPVAF